MQLAYRTHWGIAVVLEAGPGGVVTSVVDGDRRFPDSAIRWSEIGEAMRYAAELRNRIEAATTRMELETLVRQIDDDATEAA